ncbi:tRNA glutamyl-Q(34) synthetase GluQRS [Roseibium salinum]|uniref:tRNA glutamyl-Q(34) synthetase GluQRS n=1 Tax=Roseibium salinum TaxID=1604349 RepID=A0ABT3R6V3_9HYPH|nr:tRNA glutamyl-Q(34) synthetase GluQRS [Roseibium sp. DSM 29163]MCX2725019.1 tRNA glutamyl-Q(34) synthetase GluQRS [Roseibium sp. DSM 29163]
MPEPVFRFAPSPNGHLHLGHALSALLNARAAVALSGRLLVRLEDIDRTRCTPELEREMLEDLAWLGLQWEEPVLRQSDCFPQYREALERLQDMGLVYPAYLTRAEVRSYVSAHEAEGKPWPRDPDGAPVYPRDEVVISQAELSARADSDAPFALRLDMTRALARLGGPLFWEETGAEGPALFAPGKKAPVDAAAWGDVVLARKDTPTSYHLAVVVDDARQGITDVLRGLDLYHATSVHRVLQELLGLPAPRYRHHRLILGEDGRKLSKSSQDTSLRSLRAAGMTHTELRRKIGF